VNQHRARENKLFDLEFLEVLQEPLGAAHRDLLVKRARFAQEIVIGGEMDYRGDAVPVCDSDALKRAFDSGFRGQVDAYAFRSWRRRVRRHPIEADQGEFARELVDQSRANEAAAAGDNHDLTFSH
jgi:hypothetical protein